jgi:hypothetical protein
MQACNGDRDGQRTIKEGGLFGIKLTYNGQTGDVP